LSAAAVVWAGVTGYFSTLPTQWRLQPLSATAADNDASPFRTEALFDGAGGARPVFNDNAATFAFVSCHNVYDLSVNTARDAAAAAAADGTTGTTAGSGTSTFVSPADPWLSLLNAVERGRVHVLFSLGDQAYVDKFAAEGTKASKIKPHVGSALQRAFQYAAAAAERRCGSSVGTAAGDGGGGGGDGEGDEDGVAATAASAAVSDCWSRRDRRRVRELLRSAWRDHWQHPATARILSRVSNVRCAAFLV
jgi:hypothetical protein